MALLSNCLPVSPSVNKIFKDCCCEITCFLKKKTASPTRTVTNIQPTGAFASLVTIVSVNGIPYTGGAPAAPFPLTVSGVSNIPVVLQICSPSVLSVVQQVGIQITWSSQGGGSSTQFFDFEAIDPALQFSPLSGLHDFGMKPLNSINNYSITFTNPTICNAELTPSFTPFGGGNCSDLTIDQPSPFIVPAGTSLIINYTWNPQTVGLLDCISLFSLCGNSVYHFEFKGVSISNNNCLSCNSIDILTEDDFIPVDALACSGAPAFTSYFFGAIGEKKTFRFNLFYSLGLTDGIEFFFNPELFADICNFGAYYGSGQVDSAPPVSFYVQYFSGSGTQNMTLIGAGAATNTQRNFEARLVESLINPGFEFSIELDLFLTADVDSWLDSTFLQNNDRLLKNSFLSALQLDNSIPSVYNQLRKGCFLTYTSDPNILVLNQFGQPVPATCQLVTSANFAFRFYNRGLYDGPSEFTNPVFSFTRNGSPVSDFSSIFPTEVEFFIDSPFAGPVQNVVFHLINVSNFNNSVNFYQNYDSSRAEITTIGAPGIIDNHLQAPSVGPTLVSGSTYSTKAFVGSSVDFGSQYRIIAIVYDGPNKMVNSFISDVIEVTNIPSPSDGCCPLDVKSFFDDYNKTLTTFCAKVTPKERIRHRAEATGGDLITCLQEWTGQELPLNAWIQYLKSVRLNVFEEVVDYPSPGQITSFFFGEYQSNRVVGFPGNFNNLNPEFSVKDNQPLSPIASFKTSFEFRVRYESALSPIKTTVASSSTPFSRTIVPAALASVYAAANNVSFNWAGKTINLEYQVEFDFSALLGIPFEVVQVYRALLPVEDFEGTFDFDFVNSLKFYKPDETDPSVPGEEITGPFCPSDVPFLFAETTKIIEDDLTLIATIEPAPGSVLTLEEEESYSSGASVPLVQLSTPKLFDVDSNFAPDDKAFFKIDLSTLSPGEYIICSIVKNTRK